MVHTRINERESNPNPHVNFIQALPYGDNTEEESARQLLRALAAQVKPVMQAHGFEVNSLEEVRMTSSIPTSPVQRVHQYEFNRVFAGRNWNQGETVGESTREAHVSLQSTVLTGVQNLFFVAPTATFFLHPAC